MLYSFTLFVLTLGDVVAGEIFKFPLPNGFPNVSPATLSAIEYQAGGPFPAPSPGGGSKLSPTAGQALQALAFNEIFEVAFFTQLLQNITKSVPGYDLGDDRDQVLAAVNSSQAQEEIHYLNANMGLGASGFTPIQPCEYMFPVETFQEAMAMADNFAGMLIGAVPSVITDFGASPQIVTLFSSILGQEGQQDGYFRWLLSRVPNENAFLTPTTLSLLYNHINQHYIVPGSCPQKFDLPVFNKLLALESPPPMNTTISFNTTRPDLTSAQYVAYMSGQTAPVVVAISDIMKSGNGTTFQAEFPYNSMTNTSFSRGLTVAALVKNHGPFTSVAEVANATLAGPALIQVNYD